MMLYYRGVIKTRPFPARAAARQAALIPPLLARVSADVGAGRPADVALAAFFREHREFGARDRRLFSQAVFSYFRWLGWLRDVEPGRAAALAWLKDTGEAHPAIDILLGDGAREIPVQPLDRLVPDWLRAELAGDFDRFVNAIQVRPPTWLRMRADDRAEPIEPTDLTALRRKLGPVFEVQDLASQCVGSVCEPKPGEAMEC